MKTSEQRNAAGQEALQAVDASKSDEELRKEVAILREERETIQVQRQTWRAQALDRSQRIAALERHLAVRALAAKKGVTMQITPATVKMKPKRG